MRCERVSSADEVRTAIAGRQWRPAGSQCAQPKRPAATARDRCEDFALTEFERRYDPNGGCQSTRATRHAHSQNKQSEGGVIRG
jgi:hypothetical protein